MKHHGAPPPSPQHGRVEAGFTLIELMIVVAILGLLASVAIPEYVLYVRRSRTVEVIEGLRRIADGAEVFHRFHHVFPHNGCSGGICTGNSIAPAMTHTSACANFGGVFPATALASFTADPWKQLGFQPSAPIRYRYLYVASSSKDTAIARVFALGDLNCDGATSVWRIQLSREGAGDRKIERTAPHIWSGAETD